MKPLLTLAFVSAVGTLGAQSFEWDTPAKKAPAVQAKEIVVPPATDVSDMQYGQASVYTVDADGSRTAYGEVYEADQLTASHATLPLGTLLRVTNDANGRTVVLRVTDKGRECTDCLITLSEAAAKALGIVAQSEVSFERAGFSNWNPLPPASDNQLEEKGVVAAPQQLMTTVAKSAPVEVAPEPQVTFNRRPTPAVAPPSPTVPNEQEQRVATTVAKSPTVSSVTPKVPMADYAVQLAAYSNETYAKRRVTELQEQGIADVFYRVVTKPDGQVINRVYAGAYVNINEAQAAAKELEGKYKIAGIVAKM